MNSRSHMNARAGGPATAGSSKSKPARNQCVELILSITAMTGRPREAFRNKSALAIHDVICRSLEFDAEKLPPRLDKCDVLYFRSRPISA